MLYYYTVYAKSDCGYCARAIGELGRLGLDHLLVLLDKAPDFHAHLKKEYEHCTVPLIIKSCKTSGDDIEFVGGYDDLMMLLAADGYTE
jgi:glutaredoxin